MKHNSNKFYSYIRVSTKDQERGASLDEQLRQIKEYAKDKDFEIVKEYREIQSASKIGRVEFTKMIKELRKDFGIRGVIFHAVDRSARNPYDQAKLYELKEAGYELHFAVDRVNSTDHSAMSMIFIRWGVASYFSENLKVETKKGIMGRLHEGKYPSRAPIGYLDRLEAKKFGIEAEPGIKIIDPLRGPLIRKAFEIYSTGEYTVQNLNTLLTNKGLLNKGNRPLYWKMLYGLLRNPFYYGYIRYNDVLYKGKHKPIIKKALFDKAQLAIENKANKFKKTHFYMLQGLLKCETCKRIMRSITAKKKYRYFYCKKQDCGYKNIVQQEKVENKFQEKLEAISFRNYEIEAFKTEIKNIKSDMFGAKKIEIKSLDLEVDKLESLLSTLVDRFVEGSIPEEIYKGKKNSYLNSLATYQERRTALAGTDDKILGYIEELGKLLKSPILLYKSMNPDQKRNFIKSMVENFSWDGSNIGLVWKKPFNLIAERPILDDGDPDGI